MDNLKRDNLYIGTYRGDVVTPFFIIVKNV